VVLKHRLHDFPFPHRVRKISEPARRRNDHATKPLCAASSYNKIKENGVPGGTPRVHIP